MFFRFGNSIFEPLWHREYVEKVTITVAENIGIENRSRFYEKSGVVRDIVQNHLMQLIALIAMEPPDSFNAESIRNERVKVLKSIKPLTEEYVKENMIRGQYGAGKIKGKGIVGYRKENGVDPKSNTPTYFEGKFLIDNWRWADVPFYTKVGKRMKKKLTEIVVQFKQPPLKLFGKDEDCIEPNQLVIQIQPEERIYFRINVKMPGIGNKQKTVNLHFDYEELGEVEQSPAYERLIIDCVRGDQTLFARQDGIEAMWNVVDPINEYWENNAPNNFPNYEAGTWGPNK